MESLVPRAWFPQLRREWPDLGMLGTRFDLRSPRVDVVDQEVPNAFALPGGSIFISRGLLQLANSEDELACVVGHEIVHAASRHAAARQQMVKQVPGIFQFMQQPSLAAYGRDQERAADRLGQGLAGLAGYDPKGMATFLKQLEFTRLSVRPRHPKADEAAQQAFKKTSPPW